LTWVDFALIGVVILFLAVGARVGSLWSAACLTGGFLGAYMVDTYALSVSSMFGHFWGALFIAKFLLFVVTLLFVLVPGYALSQVTSMLFVGFIDTFFGLISGLCAGLFLITIAFLLVVPAFPKFEASDAWHKSMLVRPVHHFVEKTFESRWSRKAALGVKVEVDKMAGNVIDKIKH
jgi:uncharacterized membrane protein required for colicin V production